MLHQFAEVVETHRRDEAEALLGQFFENRKDVFRAWVVVGRDDHEALAAGFQSTEQRRSLGTDGVSLGRDRMKNHDAEVVERNRVTGLHLLNRHPRRAGMCVEFGRADVVDAVG